METFYFGVVVVIVVEFANQIIQEVVKKLCLNYKFDIILYEVGAGWDVDGEGGNMKSCNFSIRCCALVC